MDALYRLAATLGISTLADLDFATSAPASDARQETAGTRTRREADGVHKVIRAMHSVAEQAKT
ncbi:hypothetical protein [Streptomyces sp. NBC_01176]|uniref:hypothetical protein n=1 Tax=Streptomyces sp. NBC_01176 TaxID=2903760 RepID=UPI003869B4C8|nr:hypothetical protein OG199_41980 [Streptomyces sp. NBC_01176]